jgi:hypothetical protein
MGPSLLRSRDSSSGIATGYRLDGRGSTPGTDIFLFSIASRPALGPTQPPIQWFLWEISPEPEADHSPPSIVEVKVLLYLNSPTCLYGTVLKIIH